ncbi:MAG: protoporphyrin/coproporphyrin ferrochelatase [Actinomycetota bacterium]|nr:protoporphyrin/coproporphyrin ferrochelatase [Actinomycetota bacterium]
MTSPHPGSDTSPLDPYDGILLLSFGGPDRREDVMPFLRNVTAGRGIPDERLAEVAEHYYGFGGHSPINDLNRLLLAALRSELDRRELITPLVWGNRNFDPFLVDTLRRAHEAGMRRLVTIVTSAYTSYSSCRQYREDLADAALTLADEGREIEVDKVRPYFNHPGFSRTNARQVTEAVRQLRSRPDDEVRLVFVTHSIPEAMDDTSGPGDGEGNEYRRQHLALAQAITGEVNATLGRGLDHELVYCSRSGPPTQPWLEPDVNDALPALAAGGVRTVVVAPIGFVSDHMEVKYDLDTEAASTAAALGLEVVRVPTAGTDPEFVSGLVDLALERAAQARGVPVASPVWPSMPGFPDHAPPPSVCAPGCCPNLRTAKPALCGSDR